MFFSYIWAENQYNIHISSFRFVEHVKMGSLCQDQYLLLYKKADIVLDRCREKNA